MDEKGDKLLFSEFPEISTSAWEEKIITDLKGADYQRKLIWNTDEGIAVKPYYREMDLESLGYLEEFHKLKKAQSTPGGWTICQDIFPGKDPKEGNRRIIIALKGGAQAIRIHLPDTLPELNKMLDILLEGIPLDKTELIFRGYPDTDALYKGLIRLVGIQEVDPSDLKGSLGADPLGKMTATGIPSAGMENMGNLIRVVRKDSPGLKVIDINGALIQNAGGTLAEELAFALAMASDYLDFLTTQGIDPEAAQETMRLNFAVGPQYFLEIAKLRAARILWNQIGEAYGIKSDRRRIGIHASSSEWNMTLYDPYMNMLRGTTEAMSSILGGAGRVSVLPYDYPYGKTTEFSERIARNVQIMLREESYFDRVTNPATGSYYIENLTDALGEKAWDLFCQVESRGGYRKVFESGWIQEQILASRKKKIAQAASGKGKILGTNAFPNFNELILQGANQPEDEGSDHAQWQPLRPFRLSSIFEEVRLETEKSGKRPKVLLLKFGDPAWRSARATFAGNFFASAGYEILDHPPMETVDQAIQAIKQTESDITVLCSSDDAYSAWGPGIAEACRKSSIIVIAGNPAEGKDLFHNAGIEHFIHMKSNLLETLQHFNSILL